MNKELLTVSRMATRRSCPRRDWFAYELRLKKEVPDAPLRIGGAMAKAKEAWRNNLPETTWDEEIEAAYEFRPDWVDSYQWEIEKETVFALFRGWIDLHQNDDLEIVEVEHEFKVPLINPMTGRASRTFWLAGKIDLIAKVDRRLAVVEDKTTSDDIADGSDYWQRVRYDNQISTYVIGARLDGFPIAMVLWDVIRKPTIKPRQIPLRDADGKKVVLDGGGQRVITSQGKPRQTADKNLGYVLQSRPETPAEWSARLYKDICARPEWYYQQREVPRLEQDLIVAQAEIWQQAQALRYARKHNWWWRNPSPMTCKFCRYKDICLGNIEIDVNHPPDGFKIEAVAHSELSREGQT